LGATAGTPVYAGTSGTIVDAEDANLSGDAGNPGNVVVDIGGRYVVYGHTNGILAPGTRVGPDTQIGTVGTHPDTTSEHNNDHVHLVVIELNSGRWRVYNPALLFAPDSPIRLWTNWDEYSGENTFLSMSSFLYSNTSYWTDPKSPNIDAHKRGDP
jgi:murein DD-endopeptidase MepM/ murein hydrolase activator NlpD